LSARLFTNNANSTLAAPITSTATSLSLTSGGGALFPAPAAGQSFTVTLVKNGTPSTYEIVLVTARATDSFTSIARGQEGTTALSWNAGDFVYLYPTAGDLQQFAQFGDLQAQLGNYAIDTGSANAYAVALTPALTAHVVGMPIRFLAGHTCTGASTFTDGVAAGSLVYPDGKPLLPSTIVAGGIYTAFWAGSEFQLDATDLTNYATTAMLAAYATLVDLEAYAPLNDPALTGVPTCPTAATSTNTGQIASTEFVQNVCNGEVSTATDGYEVRPTGIIEMWGTVAYSGVSPQNVTFPTITGSSTPGFPTACTGISIVPIANGSTTVESFGLEGAPSTNKEGFTLNSGAGLGFTWRAVGH
jgi:hypothetical protein